MPPFSFLLLLLLPLPTLAQLPLSFLPYNTPLLPARIPILTNPSLERYECPPAPGLQTKDLIEIPGMYFDTPWKTQRNGCGRCVMVVGKASQTFVVARVFRKCVDIACTDQGRMDFASFGTLRKLEAPGERERGYVEVQWAFVDCGTLRPESFGSWNETGASGMVRTSSTATMTSMTMSLRQMNATTTTIVPTITAAGKETARRGGGVFIPRPTITSTITTSTASTQRQTTSRR
ncbi:hypothetical protein HDV05_005193 [Chytridiales sp. JEL 0842]|nr:hypothetical protein HDV05_005193 [Chytridiales sp. JEL 0842]